MSKPEERSIAQLKIALSMSPGQCCQIDDYVIMDLWQSTYPKTLPTGEFALFPHPQDKPLKWFKKIMGNKFKVIQHEDSKSVTVRRREEEYAGHLNKAFRR